MTGRDLRDGSVRLRDLNARDHGALLAAAQRRALRPPPPGTELRGAGMISDIVATSNALVEQFTTVPVPLLGHPLRGAREPAPRNAFFGGDSDVPLREMVNRRACAGSLRAPTARPGFLCVHLGVRTNVTPGAGFISGGIDSNARDAAERSGFLLRVSSEALGRVRLPYVWAYTAPGRLKAN